MHGDCGAGWFPLTESEEECVMALKTDPLDRLLLAGDTAGAISIYDITKFCTTPHKPQVSTTIKAIQTAHFKFSENQKII